MENWAARAIGGVLALIGVVLLGVYPFTRMAAARERSDIDRALAPLLNVPLEQLRASNARTFAVSVPTDPQWTRIVKRVGRPSFLVVAVRDYGWPTERVYSSPEIGLDLHVRKNGADVVIAAVTDTAESYSAHASTRDGIRFDAEPGDALDVIVRVRAPVPAPAPRSVLLLTSNWGAKVGAWAEGSSIGFAAEQVVALASAITGGLFLWWGSTFAWGRPEPTA